MRSAQLAGLPGNQGLWVQGTGWRPCLRAQSPDSSQQCLGTEVWTKLELTTRFNLRPAPDGHSVLELERGPALEWGRGATVLGLVLISCSDLWGQMHCPALGVRVWALSPGLGSPFLPCNPRPPEQGPWSPSQAEAG